MGENKSYDKPQGINNYQILESEIIYRFWMPIYMLIDNMNEWGRKFVGTYDLNLPQIK